MKVKFPVLIKYEKQYEIFMAFLERHNIVWGDGSNATSIICPHFPVYITYDNGRIYRLFYYKGLTYENAVNCCEGERPIELEFEDE